MKKNIFYAIALLFSTFVGQAQDIKQAKIAIDAEQFEKARTILESLIKTKPSDGYATFILGNVCVAQGDYAAAKRYYDTGISCAEKANFNYIGLGMLALNNGDKTAAESNFALATKDSKKKNGEEFIYIGKAYTYSEKPEYKKAVEILSSARATDPENTMLLLALGDAYKFHQKQNEAYDCYREAFRLDKTLLRAKMGLGTLIKNAHNFPVAITAFDEVIALNPNYGPVYRELAETQYLWALNDGAKYNEHIAKGLTYYEKYMSLTDYSLNSRMRHADFLILARDYKALEIEANEMSKIDNVNPRIYRYLGYSAYYNEKYDLTISSLNSFIVKPENKTIARDYFYLGSAKIMKAISVTPMDSPLFDSAILDLRKAYDMSPLITYELPELGKKLYDKKLFVAAASVYEIAIMNTENKTYLTDNFYFGSSVYWSLNGVENLTPTQIEQLKKADASLDVVIVSSPSTQDAYLFKARIQVLLKNDAMVSKNYEDFITAVTKKDPKELSTKGMKAKLVEAYNNVAIIYAATNTAKAKEYFNKTLGIDPVNQFAIDSLKSLK
jgi:Tfp pilus assembly protein PilF